MYTPVNGIYVPDLMVSKLSFIIIIIIIIYYICTRIRQVSEVYEQEQEQEQDVYF